MQMAFFFLPSLMLSGFMSRFRGCHNGLKPSVRSFRSPILHQIHGFTRSKHLEEMAFTALANRTFAAIALTIGVKRYRQRWISQFQITAHHRPYLYLRLRCRAAWLC